MSVKQFTTEAVSGRIEATREIAVPDVL